MTISSLDYISDVESAIKNYIAGKFATDSLVEVRIGYPNFTNNIPLNKIIITVYNDNSKVSASGYDNILDVNTETGIEIFGSQVDADICVDVWSSRGSATNPSKSGGKAGAQRYMSAVAQYFTNYVFDFYIKYPDADIESFDHKYTLGPERFDDNDLYQCHSELRVNFPIERN